MRILVDLLLKEQQSKLQSEEPRKQVPAEELKETKGSTKETQTQGSTKETQTEGSTKETQTEESPKFFYLSELEQPVIKEIFEPITDLTNKEQRPTIANFFITQIFPMISGNLFFWEEDGSMKFEYCFYKRGILLDKVKQFKTASENNKGMLRKYCIKKTHSSSDLIFEPFLKFCRRYKFLELKFKLSLLNDHNFDLKLLGEIGLRESLAEDSEVKDRDILLYEYLNFLYLPGENKITAKKFITNLKEDYLKQIKTISPKKKLIKFSETYGEVLKYISQESENFDSLEVRRKS
jgi:hypothetical protein